MTTRSSFTYTLSPEQQQCLIEVLTGGNYEPMTVQHARCAARTSDCTIVLYRSGKCLVQGSRAEDFVTFVLEPLVLQKVELGYEDILNPAAVQPHIGVDESGKGDFFGPLIIAAAYVDESLAKTMRAMNVRDSKRISSDDKALELGRELRRLLGRRWAVVKIGPAAYNRLYARLRNVNKILGWGHARAIENLLEVVPDCTQAVADQFGSEEQIRNALMKKGRRITLLQRHRAESDLAVAAASILAREAFLRGLKELQEKYETPLPKGASDAVQQAAVQLVRKAGPQVLLETAKCHFKTTDTVLRELNLSRADIGPEGQAISRPHAFKPKVGV